MPDTPATSPAPQRPALSAASQEAVAEVERKLGAGYSMSQATLHVVARLAALEADVQRNREQVEQSAGMLMALRTENAEWRQQVAEWRAKAATLEAERDALVPQARLGLWELDAEREGLTPDGGDLQDEATNCGVIAPVEATEPCGEPPCFLGCTCVEYDDFPQLCYRDTPATIAARKLLAPPAGGTA